MNILKETAQQFFFFDVEALALADVTSFATANGLSSKVKTLCQDSIQGTIHLLSSLPGTSLLHIDPYQIDQPGKEGYTYLDVFVKATELGMKCVLWYGFNTLNEKRKLNDYIRQSLSHSKGDNLYCVEWIMNRIQQDTVFGNPGILGNGLLTGNLSEETNHQISEYTYLLEKIYQGRCYKDLDGGYYKEEISL
ncbi:MAG: hypothetical protein LUE93_09915 [Bacteroides sp.]|nr:hypothetical protein [Bacteroides sp.]